MAKIFIEFCIFLVCVLIAFCDELESSSFCEVQDTAKDLGFIRIGRYRGFTDKGSEYQKTYLMSRYLRTTWFKAKSICKSFDLELASFETLKEAEYFLEIAKNHPFVHALWATYMLVDGMTDTPNTTTEWYWTNSGNKLSYSLPWQKGNPNNFGGIEYCMAFTANEPSSVGFNDFPCDYDGSPFVCQRVDFFAPARSN